MLAKYFAVAEETKSTVRVIDTTKKTVRDLSRGAAGIWERSRRRRWDWGRSKQIYQLAKLGAGKDLKVLFVSKMT